jgi:hyaluronan synthase
MPESQPITAPSTYDLFVTEPAPDLWDWLLRSAIVLGLAAILYACIEAEVFEPLLHGLRHHGWSSLLVRPGILWLLMGTLLLAFRTLLWFRYRPFMAATLEDAPPLTVVIPAYNEGAMVAQTIDSVARAHYPRERLEILVVDDGSRDDTWEHIERAAAHHAGRVTTLRFPENRGKREALAAGFRQARGEILVTIDSDSVIEPDTLLALAGPFRNPRIGAVAGKVLVHNRRQGLIPRMLHVRFMLSFDFLRAAQSTYGTVYCTPGALSAYRASAVRQVLEAWLHQTFLGVPTTIGEDRAITNFLFEIDYDAVYQRRAVVHTIVPTSYVKLCRMYLRWDRSYVREELRFLRIVWRRPLKARLIALVDTLITNLRYPVTYTSLVLLTILVWEDPEVLLRTLLAIGLMSTFYMLYYLRSERSADMLYGVLYSYFAFFSLFWIFPYAALTLRARSWMTR